MDGRLNLGNFPVAPVGNHSFSANQVKLAILAKWRILGKV